MPNRLKGLEVTKVDFVDAGDNKRADVVLFKRRDGEPAAGPEAAPQAESGHAGVLKRFLATIAKKIGVSDDEVQAAMEAIEKDATTFDEKVAERNRRKTADEIWDYCWMLQDSLCSIFWDGDLTDAEKEAKMGESLAEFNTAMQRTIPKWAGGEPAAIIKATPTVRAERLEFAKRTRDRLDDMISKAEPPAPAGQPADPMPAEGGTPTTPTGKGETNEMKIDKSKLSPEELAALDAIEKKAGIPDEEPPAGGNAPTEEPPVAKNASAAVPAEPAEGDDDIYKGLHPAVRAELERLRKQADAAEERELRDVAKKYEIIGKKADELVPMLKSLKAAGGDAYGQMIAVLDASVAAVEKSGIFSEIGKSGGASAGAGSDAWAQIEKHAEAIQKAAPTMTWAQAVDKACQQHPDLVHDYEAGRQ